MSSSSTPFDYDFSPYPPFYVLWGMGFLDYVCVENRVTSSLLHCRTWREECSSNDGPFSSYCSQIYEQTVWDARPDMMTFPEFYQQQQNDDSSLFSLLYKYAFQTSSTSLSDLTTPTALLVIFVLVLLLRAIKSVLLPFFSSIGRQAGRAAHGEEWERDNEIRIVKFGEYVFRLLYHSVITILGIYWFYDSPWWSESTLHLWKNWPYQPVTPTMTWYYLVQGAYNVEALVSLLELSFELRWSKHYYLPTIHWSSTCRGDFREMAIHHVVTNLLVFGSSFVRVTRIGNMVFLVHDISDIPVDLSKLANFVKWKVSTVVCFLTMVVCWLVFRLGIFPFVIYRSLLFECQGMLESGILDPALYLSWHAVFVYLCGQIIVLHLTWFLMFLRMFYFLVRKGETHDLSEHKQGEKQVDGRNAVAEHHQDGDARNGGATGTNQNGRTTTRKNNGSTNGMKKYN